MKKTLITLSILLSGLYLTSALSLDLSGGDILYKSNWDDISSIVGKINLDNNNLNINGKLVLSGELCAGEICLSSEDGSIGNPGDSCVDLLNKGVTVSGNYYIKPAGYIGNAIKVYCDMNTNGGGRMRYVKIDGLYDFYDAWDCWKRDNGIQNYNNLECFNPNRYNISTNNIRVKVNGNNYYKSMVTTPSVDTSKKSVSYDFYCLGNPQYMVVGKHGAVPDVEPSEDESIWLGYSYCGTSRSGGSWELGGRTTSVSVNFPENTNKYMNYSHSGLGPTPGGWEDSVDPVEIFIR